MSRVGGGRAEAPAKVNLWLEVHAREESGYHQIETLFCGLALSDDLELEILRRPGLRVDVVGADVGRPDENLVRRAALAFAAESGREPRWGFRLRKRIPVGAGLGGGSSDAAATLHLLNGSHDSPLDDPALLRLGAGLGSDVPFFVVDGRFALGWGRGERLLPLASPPARPALICMPPFSSPTSSAYAKLAAHREREAAQPCRSRSLAPVERLSEWSRIAALSCNDFETVLFNAHPALARLHELLQRGGALIARLAGSGAAVFGIFEDSAARDDAAERIMRAEPQTRTFVTWTRGVSDGNERILPG